MTIRRFGAEGGVGTGGQHLPFARAVAAGGWLYVSGQTPMVNGEVIEGGIVAQSHQTIRNLVAVLQEAGYSSAPQLGSSPSAQASFVRNVLSAANRTPAAIPFVSFYALLDEPAVQCRDHSDAVTFFCSLGLNRSDGRPKPAWAAFRKGIRAAG